MRFTDRADAGRKLAEKLEKYKNNKDAIVIGLPRGGVVTAYEVAKELNLPLDIIVTRKIGAPEQPELALGALAQDGEAILDKNLIDIVEPSDSDLHEIIENEQYELRRRIKLYRGDWPKLNLDGKTVILVDDGLATGATMRAAIISAQKLNASKIVVAVPVSPLDTLKKIGDFAQEVVCLYMPETSGLIFWGVGGFYDNFLQVTDGEVIDLLSNIGKS